MNSLNLPSDFMFLQRPTIRKTPVSLWIQQFSLHANACFPMDPAVFIACKRLFPYGSSSFHLVQTPVSLWIQQFSSHANACFPMDLAVFIPCKRLFPYGTSSFHLVQTPVVLLHQCFSSVTKIIGNITDAPD